MVQKSLGRRAVMRHDEEDAAFEAGGVVARIADRALDNPAMSGGLIVMALTALAIVSNATLLQSAKHPDPLFMTRPATDQVPAPASAVPLPRPRAEQSQAVPPLPRLAPTQTSEAKPAPDTVLIADLQRALASRGLYKGSVDGISGSRTRSAITAYQAAQGLAVTGEPSPTILDHIKATSIQPAAPAEPVSATPVASVAAPAPKIAAITAPTPSPAKTSIPVPVTVSPPAHLDAPSPQAAVAPAKPDPTEIERRRYRRVQDALNQIGYGPVPTDGTADAQTINAIRRFELDNGLAITGQPDKHVIERMITIGAMSPT